MGKNKVRCWACEQKHYPPTGKNCAAAKKKVEELKVVDVGDHMSSSENEDRDSLSSYVVKQKNVSAAGKTSRSSKKSKAARSADTDSDAGDSMDEGGQRDMQRQILDQLQKMNSRLQVVESQMGDKQGHKKKCGSKGQKTKLSTVTSTCKRNCKKDCCVNVSSDNVTSGDTSDDDVSLPDLAQIRTSKIIQKQIDRSIAKLGKQQVEGMENSSKLKSKRGGAVDVVVQQKVAWPHEHILGGHNWQRLTYDQISMPQFVQGFVKNMLDEQNLEYREHMLHYLGDIMEDAADFSWQSAKASHAVLLCEMERGKLTWSDTSRIDRVRRAYAQKHQTSSKQSWVTKNTEKKPWFCKFYQNGSCNFEKDHEFAGRMHRHICAYCLSQGKQLNHPEKECTLKKVGSKNGQMAAHL